MVCCVSDHLEGQHLCHSPLRKKVQLVSVKKSYLKNSTAAPKRPNVGDDKLIIQSGAAIPVME